MPHPVTKYLSEAMKGGGVCFWLPVEEAQVYCSEEVMASGTQSMVAGVYCIAWQIQGQIESGPELGLV